MGIPGLCQNPTHSPQRILHALPRRDTAKPRDKWSNKKKKQWSPASPFSCIWILQITADWQDCRIAVHKCWEFRPDFCAMASRHDSHDKELLHHWGNASVTSIFTSCSLSWRLGGVLNLGSHAKPPNHPTLLSFRKSWSWSRSQIIQKHPKPIT